MTLKKSATSAPSAGKSKRANPPREFTRTKEFKKDWDRLSQSGRYDMNRLKEVMLLLIENTAPLASEWRDHTLSGNWLNYRECHIGGDFLLIYKLNESNGDQHIVFVRTGTHSELFG